VYPSVITSSGGFSSEDDVVPETEALLDYLLEAVPHQFFAFQITGLRTVKEVHGADSVVYRQATARLLEVLKSVCLPIHVMYSFDLFTLILRRLTTAIR